jgi:hypothetical protein
MHIEQETRNAMHRYTKRIQPDAGLDALVADSFARYSKSKQRKSSFTKIIVTTGIACALVLPTAAFTMPQLADKVYGSFSAVKTKVAAFTFEQYTSFGMKLSGAKQELGDDYPKFISLIKVIAASKVEYGDSTGNIDFTTLPKQKHEQLRQVYYDIQPYFDRLNHQKPSKDILSEAEYNQYIDALIQHQTIVVKAGLNPSKGPIDAGQLPIELQDDYDKTERILQEARAKQGSMQQPVLKR